MRNIINVSSHNTNFIGLKFKVFFIKSEVVGSFSFERYKLLTFFAKLTVVLSLLKINSANCFTNLGSILSNELWFIA